MGNTFSPQTPSYATVVSQNPYATGISSKFGSIYSLNDFLTKQNKTIENEVPQLYDRLFNPSLDDAISQARIEAFQKSFNKQSKDVFENNLINPLSERNMLRSSLLNDMTKNYQENQASQIANFNTNLLNSSIADTQSLIQLLMNQYSGNSNYGKQVVSTAQNDSSRVNSYNLNNYSQVSKNSVNQNLYQNMNTLLTLLSTI